MKALYSVGDCPVCADSGAVIVLKVIGSDRFIFYCPTCGVAWRTPPPERTLNEINSLKDLAPDGVAIPTAYEALESGCDPVTIEFEEWFPHLEFRLQEANIPLNINDE